MGIMGTTVVIELIELFIELFKISYIFGQVILL